YYSSTSLVARLPRLQLNVDIGAAVPWLLAASFVATALRIVLFGRIRLSESYAQIFQLIQHIGDLSAAGLLLAHLRGRLRRWQLAYLGAAVLSVAAVAIATSLLANAMLALVPLVFIYVWEKGRWPLRAMLVCMLILAPLNVTKAAFRARYGIYAASPELDPTHSGLMERLTTFVTVTEDTIFHGDLTADTVGLTGAQRANFLATMVLVVETTPREVPYWDGYTYSGFAWHFIPRLFVPNKPIVNLGQEFPRRYALIDYGDDVTSYNLPQIVEMYINFGPIGVILGMALIGLIYRTIEHIGTGTVGAALVGAQVCAGLMNVESDFSIAFAPIIYHGLGLTLFVSMLPRIKGTSGRPA
ncbi:MAG: hypothetical protein ACYC6M_15180, partial [Terriglobales bacterium]